MLKIGDFSRLSRVSIRMLRYYDENNLLRPVKIDALNGYRYYEESQLSDIGKIVALKEMGFSVAAIKEVLKCDKDSSDLERLFAIKRAQLLDESAEIKKRIQLLDTALKRLREEKTMNYNCVIKEMPERYVASVRMTIPRYEDEGKVWHYLFSETAHQNMQICGPCMAVFHDKEYKEENIDVEVQVPVKGDYIDTEHVSFKKEQGATVVSTTFYGSYSQFTEAYAVLAAWTAENDYAFCGAMMDIYHVGINKTQNPDELVTEICCPVEKKVD